jgi:hypothetical protein
MSYMGHVSRPLIGLLVATVAFFAVWTLALKPSSSGSGGSGSSGAGSSQSAIDKAHQAVTTANKASVAHGATVVTSTPHPAATTPTTPAATTPAPTTPAATTPAATTPAASSPTKAASGPTTSTKPSSGSPTTAAQGTAKDRSAAVTQALRAHKVVAMLFFNPLGSDDRAVKRELSTIPVHGGKVVKLAVPLRELSRYEIVTSQVPIESSPTLVLIDRSHQASTIIGYASRFEIAYRVDDALTIK